MKKFLTAFLLLLPSVMYGTAIILVKKGNSYYLGVDSRTTEYDYNPVTKKQILSGKWDDACKIVKAGKFYYGLAADDIDYLKPNIDKLCTSTASFDALRNRLNGLQQDLFRHIKSNSSTVNRYSILPVGTPIAQVVFIGFENSKPRVLSISFYIKEQSVSGFMIAMNVANDPGFAYSGLSTIANPIDAKKAAVDNPVLFINRVIKAEAKIRANDVNGPIHILKVSEKGFSWIQNKNKCA